MSANLRAVLARTIPGLKKKSLDKKKEDKPKEDKPKEDKPKEDKPKEDKPKEDKPKEDKPKEDKPKEDKPKEDKPKEDKPKEDKPKEDKPKDKPPSSEIPTILAVVVLVLPVAIALYLAYPQDKPNVYVNTKSFQQNLMDLKDKFKNQKKYLWKAVGKLGADHIDSVSRNDVKRPLVFLLVSSEPNEKTMSCLSKKIAMSFMHSDTSNNHQEVFINGNDVANSAHSKEILDDKLNETLTKTEGVVVITKIGSLSYDIASIFFKYCDNEGAPYPKAVFVFTLTLPGDDSLLNKEKKEVTQATRRYLRSVVWKDGESTGADDLIAMIVDPAPIPVLNEDDSVVNSCFEVV